MPLQIGRRRLAVHRAPARDCFPTRSMVRGSVNNRDFLTAQARSDQRQRFEGRSRPRSSGIVGVPCLRRCCCRRGERRCGSVRVHRGKPKYSWRIVMSDMPRAIISQTKLQARLCDRNCNSEPAPAPDGPPAERSDIRNRCNLDELPALLARTSRRTRRACACRNRRDIRRKLGRADVRRQSQRLHFMHALSRRTS